jgi:hypothetical protein
MLIIQAKLTIAESHLKNLNNAMLWASLIKRMFFRLTHLQKVPRLFLGLTYLRHKNSLITFVSEVQEVKWFLFPVKFYELWMNS